VEVGEAGGAGEAAEQRKRNRVHVGSAEFRHLQDLDMNDLCERVVLVGRKPL
jgi:hypothetical protein